MTTHSSRNLSPWLMVNTIRLLATGQEIATRRAGVHVQYLADGLELCLTVSCRQEMVMARVLHCSRCHKDLSILQISMDGVEIGIRSQGKFSQAIWLTFQSVV